jgi:hypothetical protein
MKTKQQIWEFLSGNPAYQKAISGVTPEERAKIEGFLQGEFLDTLHKFEVALEGAAGDPGLQSKIAQALSGGKQVVSSTESPKPDSAG